MATYRNTYMIAGPFMDTTRPPDALPEGVLSEVWGVDGRIKGSLRRFPGCIDVDVMNASEGVTLSYTKDYLVGMGLNPPYTSMQVKIFMVAATVRYLIVVVGDTAWYSYADLTVLSNNLPSFVGPFFDFDQEITGINFASNIEFSVVSYGDTFYLFQEGSPPQFARATGATGNIAASGDMGVGSHVAGELPAPMRITPDTATGGYLNFRGSYSVAYKLYDSVRDVATGLSAIGTVTLATFNTGDNLLATVRQVENDPDFDTVLIYRSLNLRNSFDTFQGGILFLEQTMDYVGGGNVDRIIGTLHDTALVQQERYDPFADVVTSPPESGVAIVYDNTIFAAQDPSINGGVGIVWTNPNKATVEEFGSQYQYNGRADDGRPLRMILAGDNMFVLTSSVIYKVRKVGSQIAINRFVLDRGLVGARAVTSLDRDLIMVTWQGVVIVNGETGASSLFASLTGFLRDNWNGNLRPIEVAYDSEMGCTFIFHPTYKEMICIWDVTRTATLLRNCDYTTIIDAIKWSSTSGMPSALRDLPATQKRAYFFNPHGGICVPDSRSVGPGTMSGLYFSNGIYHGVSDLTISSGLTDADAVFTSQWIGRRIYATEGPLTGQYGVVETINSSTSISFASGSPLSTFPEGTGYAIDPVVFEARFGSVKGLSEQPDPFVRKLVNTVELAVWNPSGDVGVAGGDKFVIGFYRNGGDTLAVSEELAITGFIPDSTVHIEIDGHILEPFITQISANTMFELTHLSVKGTITTSRDSTE